MTFRLADSILGFANSNVKDLLRKLGGITRTFSHAPSMPQFSGQFETDALPFIRAYKGFDLRARGEDNACAWPFVTFSRFNR
jgi:hypothetical protein